MNYALIFKNLSFYNELYTVWLGAILRPFWHRAGPVAEQSRAEPSRAGTGRAEPSRAGPDINYILYRTDPQKTHYKISFSANMPKHEQLFFSVYISPLTPDRPPL